MDIARGNASSTGWYDCKKFSKIVDSQIHTDTARVQTDTGSYSQPNTD
jgi:hypothetical protein